MWHGKPPISYCKRSQPDGRAPLSGIARPFDMYVGDARRADMVRDFVRADLRRLARRLGHDHEKRPVQRVGVQVPRLAALRPLYRDHRIILLQHRRLDEAGLRGALGLGELYRVGDVCSPLSVAGGVIRLRSHDASSVLHSCVWDAGCHDVS